ncbi:succinylglutamate desuccinylase/aspartoacylase family protein [Halobacterium sp. R2-5]|uniref:succinylglutamate desuccinylase/aspartoacylase domain-containing protein n=1 Tax=Halobacterium sp. R2-5 TaxID=2715751 RepID=UPI001422AC62|nr:succinylglutamate desuccinylase/aspartoacylase family protein [Halobacterium sp. R2-5]NIB99575.1 succinylglutamate desuccinylase [Halobacterium sp. R2-5]
MTDEYVPPEVTVAGPGEPEVAVVGGIHGDEPSGVRAVERLREADLDLQRGVAFVVANPAAVAADRRFLDSDLNRVFPGDPDGDREHRLADELCDVLDSLVTLSIHGTHSCPEPFALVHRSQPAEYELASKLPVRHVVDHSGVNEGTVTSCGCVVEIEVGIQGTDAAAAAAERQALAFLRRVGALPGSPPRSSPRFYHMTGAVPKPIGADAELYVENFELVPRGTVFARVDDEDLVAEDDFYPVLMSECGYADIFGYEARKLGDSLREIEASWLAEA